MLPAIPKRCPSCSQLMSVCTLRCSDCNTEIQGEFQLDRFSQLSNENVVFLETFIRLRGSLKDVGAQLNISYPTARNRLDALIEALGFGATETQSGKRIVILKELQAGIISAEEALTKIEGVGKND